MGLGLLEFVSGNLAAKFIGDRPGISWLDFRVILVHKSQLEVKLLLVLVDARSQVANLEAISQSQEVIDIVKD